MKIIFNKEVNMSFQFPPPSQPNTQPTKEVKTKWQSATKSKQSPATKAKQSVEQKPQSYGQATSSLEGKKFKQVKENLPIPFQSIVIGKERLQKSQKTQESPKNQQPSRSEELNQFISKFIDKVPSSLKGDILERIKNPEHKGRGQSSNDVISIVSRAFHSSEGVMNSGQVHEFCKICLKAYLSQPANSNSQAAVEGALKVLEEMHGTELRHTGSAVQGAMLIFPKNQNFSHLSNEVTQERVNNLTQYLMSYCSKEERIEVFDKIINDLATRTGFKGLMTVAHTALEIPELKKNFQASLDKKEHGSEVAYHLGKIKYTCRVSTAPPPEPEPSIVKKKAPEPAPSIKTTLDSAKSQEIKNEFTEKFMKTVPLSLAGDVRKRMTNPSLEGGGRSSNDVISIVSNTLHSAGGVMDQNEACQLCAISLKAYLSKPENSKSAMTVESALKVLGEMAPKGIQEAKNKSVIDGAFLLFPTIQAFRDNPSDLQRARNLTKYLLNYCSEDEQKKILDKFIQELSGSRVSLIGLNAIGAAAKESPKLRQLFQSCLLESTNIKSNHFAASGFKRLGYKF
jgi:hypothetical protein